MNNRIPILAIVCALLLPISCGPESSQPHASAGDSQMGPYPFELHDSLFARYVDDSGLVDYQALSKERRFHELVAAIRNADIEAWNREEKLAFWINSYNVLVLEGVLRHYPVESVTKIRLLHGFFKREEFSAARRTLTLDTIEHEILRKDFDEPRIHFALVCGAVSCPPLRREAYRPARLDSQLDHQAETFLANRLHNRLEREDRTLYLSSIFKWFGEDFTQDASALPQILATWLPKADGEWVRSRSELEVSFLDYDWALNDQARVPGK